MRHGAAPSGLLVLEDGTVFEGEAVSAGTRFGEVVFNTSMTGYQEVLTDPSYRGQIVVMTQPHIGNYGTSQEVAESARPWVEGFIARQFTARPSSHDSGEGLVQYLRRAAVPALHGIDTRALVRRLRERGALRGVVTSERSDVAALTAELADFPLMTGRALVDEVTTAAAYEVPAGCGDGAAPPPRGLRLRRQVEHPALAGAARRAPDRAAGPHPGQRLPGARRRRRGAVERPGRPGAAHRDHRQRCASCSRRTRRCSASASATSCSAWRSAAQTFKLKFGHHGGNQPVRDVATGKVAITSQNHGFAVRPRLAAGRPAPSPSSTSTTAPSRASTSPAGRSSRCSTTRRRPPGRTTPSGLFDRFLRAVAGRSPAAAARPRHAFAAAPPALGS